MIVSGYDCWKRKGLSRRRKLENVGAETTSSGNPFQIWGPETLKVRILAGTCDETANVSLLHYQLSSVQHTTRHHRDGLGVSGTIGRHSKRHDEHWTKAGTDPQARTDYRICNNHSKVLHQIQLSNSSSQTTTTNKQYNSVWPSIPPWVGKLNTGDAGNQRWRRNSKFYVSVGPVARTTCILT